MVALNNASSAWFNYIVNANARLTEQLIILTPEVLTKELAEYNGIVLDLENSNGWQPYFKTEQDLSYFILKWS